MRFLASRLYSATSVAHPLRFGGLMKTLLVTALCAVALLAAGALTAQSGQMMNDNAWGGGWMAGYGVIWVPLLLVLLAVAVFVLLVQRNGK
jgi:hypothetical protein